MAVEKINIDYVAKLARIELNEEEKVQFSEQLDSILGHFDKLNAVNVEGVEPMAHAVPVTNVWAEDEPGETFSPEQATQNSTEVIDNQVAVPKVVGES